MMKRVFGVKNDKGKEKEKERELPPSVHGASNRSTERGETVDEKIRKLDAVLSRYREQIKRTRPGPAQEVIKARAMRVLKQKRTYEGQRDMLGSQTSSLDQVAFAAEELKDAQQNLQGAGLETVQPKLYAFTDWDMLPTLRDVDSEISQGVERHDKTHFDDRKLRDEMMNLIDIGYEIQEALGKGYNVPNDIDRELMVVKIR